MLKKFLICLIFFLSFFIRPVFCSTQADEYLCELGVTFYRMGQYNDALTEFNKALMLNPDNQVAKSYVSTIFKRETARPLPDAGNTPLAQSTVQASKEKVITVRELIKKPAVANEPEEKPAVIQESKEKYAAAQEPEKRLSREETIDNIFSDLSRKDVSAIAATPERGPVNNEEQKAARKNPELFKLTGEAQLRLGITPHDAYWKRANWDLNEMKWRMLSNAALDRRENTYDPRIYDRLALKLDGGNNIEGLSFHTNITVDPWSFTGKSSKATVSSSFGDSAEIELKYWSNTGYTINQTIDSARFGNSFSLPEIKVENEKIKGADVRGDYTPNDTFHIPDMKIYREFQPVRELWFGYNLEDLKLKIFPIAYENQALSFDDPLRLSNNHIWWEESPWIHSWKPGVYNSGLAPVDFSKGYWDNAISFFARDSEGRRLTALRGFSFEFNPLEKTSLMASVAAPKDPWQDYSNVDNFLSAARLKQAVTDNVNAGLTLTTRMGYNTENKNKLDAENYVLGADLGYEVIGGLKSTMEVAHSQAKYDLTNPQYKTESNGNAYYLSVFGRLPLRNITEANYNYDTIKPEGGDSSFTKYRFFISRMDQSFDESLSSYVETRDDQWWSRHLHFRKPFKYYYQGEGQLLTWDDVKNSAIGNGIDIGRGTVGLRVESLFLDKKINNLFDVRNVHGTNGKFIENVSREEIAWDINDKITAKLLGIYHRLPKTHAGTDPFIFDPRTRRYLDNSAIEDSKDPSVATGSLGAEYKFFDWLALNGVWEYTNDISFNYDDFPRGILEGHDRAFTFYEYDNKYREARKFLYSQGIFPKPPYPYYNIFKTGLRFNPIDKAEIYLDYTRNPYEKAGKIDDNMNHIGFQIGYLPTEKLSLFFKYTYSRWQDLDALTQGITKMFGHSNFFTELIYRKSKDEDFTFQYGEASRDPYMGGVLDIGWDPYGGSARTMDTQHIFRLYYRRKF